MASGLLRIGPEVIEMTRQILGTLTLTALMSVILAKLLCQLALADTPTPRKSASTQISAAVFLAE